jgi:hypothetical protein
MKLLVVLSILVSAFSATAFIDSNYDRDPTEVYLSWCDQNNNVLKSTTKNTAGFEIAESCSSTQKTCVENQKTSGRHVYYYATCLDISKPHPSDYK